MRGDRVLVSDESVLGDPKPRLGLVVAFAPEDNRWHALVILDEPTKAGTAMVSVEPSATTWIPPELELRIAPSLGG